MTQYRLAKTWRLLTYVIGPPMIILFIYVLTLPFNGRSPYLYFLVPVSLGMIFLFVYGIIDAWQGRVVIADDRLVVKSPFGVRMLMREEIKGFKQDENYIYVIPLNAGVKKIKISTYVGRSHEILSWLAERFVNLDVAEVHEEEQAILRNDEFGITPEARKRRLKEARKIARAVNTISWVAVAWVLFYPKPYNTAVAVAAFFPLVIMAVNYQYRGLMSGNENKNSAYPSVATGFAVLVIALGLRAVLDFSILDYSNGWYLMGIMSVILCAVYILPTPERKLRGAKDYVFIAVMLFIMFFYSYGMFVTGNCLLDRSEALRFRATVMEKRISDGKVDTYYLKLAPWGTLKEPEEVQVTRDEYGLVSEGSEVTIMQHEGYFKMGWIYLLSD